MIEKISAPAIPTPPYVLAIGNSIGGNTSGGILFGNSANNLAQNSTNLFWDAVNSRLGIGQNVPTTRVHIKGSGSTGATSSLRVVNSASADLIYVGDNGFIGINTSSPTAALSVNNNQDNSAGGFYNLDVRNLNANGQARINFKENSVGQNRAYIAYVNYENILRIATTGSANPIYFGIADAPKLVIQSAGNVGIGTLTPSSKAALDVDSTTQGFLPPRMTTAQINAIVSPDEGLVAYNTTISHLCCYQGGAWVKFSHSLM